MSEKMIKNIKNLTNKEILNIANGINSLVSKSLPIYASYALSKNIDILNKEIEDYNKAKNKLLDKYGKKDDSGKLVKSKRGEIVLGKPEEFNNEVNELLNIENSLEVYVIKLENLGDNDFTPQEIISLKFMIEDY